MISFLIAAACASAAARARWSAALTRTASDRAARLSSDTLERISYVMGIYKALHILYGDKLADEWVRLPNANAVFNGRSPLAAMLGGGLLAMQTVRRLLDARRGGL